jgi:hypothetical protein
MLKQHFQNNVVLAPGRCCLNKTDESTFKIVELTLKQGCCLDRVETTMHK